MLLNMIFGNTNEHIKWLLGAVHGIGNKKWIGNNNNNNWYGWRNGNVFGSFLEMMNSLRNSIQINLWMANTRQRKYNYKMCFVASW